MFMSDGNEVLPIADSFNHEDHFLWMCVFTLQSLC